MSIILTKKLPHVSQVKKSILRLRRRPSVLSYKSQKGYITPSHIQFDIWTIQVYTHIWSASEVQGRTITDMFNDIASEQCCTCPEYCTK